MPKKSKFEKGEKINQFFDYLESFSGGMFSKEDEMSFSFNSEGYISSVKIKNQNGEETTIPVDSEQFLLTSEEIENFLNETAEKENKITNKITNEIC